MKISVAGQDRTHDLGRELRRQVEAMEHVAASRKLAPFPPEISALALARAQSEAEYLDRLIGLIRCRNAIDTLDFAIPRKPGATGLFMARLKALLWKLLRYQHDRVAFRQNLINTQLTSTLEFEFTQRQKETADLKRRVTELEKQGGGNLR
ncbi:MAG: hypothetical protein NT011_02465 [Kiritimatiellaeota bacterium]|nr:hypothetical protein [Kiritimatiellota bacterium]